MRIHNTVADVQAISDRGGAVRRSEHDDRPASDGGRRSRVFSSHLDDEGQEGASGSLRSKRNIRGAGSASVSWTPSATVTVFLHAASAYRPGGINVERDATQAVHDADELASLELGSHVRLGGAFSLDGTMFAARWQHVQTMSCSPTDW